VPELAQATHSEPDLHPFQEIGGCPRLIRRVTPAMETTISDHVWEIEELVALID